MMNIEIIAVGSIKDAYLREGISEYMKRLSPFANVDIIEIKEEKLPDNPSPTEIQNALIAEGKRISYKLGNETYPIALAIEGNSCSSEEFALMINDIATYNSGKLAFIIGGSNGLSDAVKLTAKKRISFSRATFPHQMMRLIILEQLYRAFMILGGRRYHK